MTTLGNNIKCYEDTYTKGECVDKEDDGYTYDSYLEDDQTCEEWCEDEDKDNDNLGGCYQY